MFAALFCLALFLALTSLASAAPADRVDVKRVTQTRQAVVDYWTAERMQNAIPADRVRGNGPGRRKRAIPFESYEYPGPYTGTAAGRSGPGRRAPS
jgi:hypothetical protein